jgi:hypothetical protein
LAVTSQINVHPPIGKDKPAIACKAVEYETQSLISFHVAGAFEELIEDSSDALF